MTDPIWRGCWPLTVIGQELERLVVVTIEAFDRNCPQHITPRFTVSELEPVLGPLHARIAELEQQLEAARKVIR